MYFRDLLAYPHYYYHTPSAVFAFYRQIQQVFAFINREVLLYTEISVCQCLSVLVGLRSNNLTRVLYCSIILSWPALLTFQKYLTLSFLILSPQTITECYKVSDEQQCRHHEIELMGLSQVSCVMFQPLYCVIVIRFYCNLFRRLRTSD